jgi:hypothetical protein
MIEHIITAVPIAIGLILLTVGLIVKKRPRGKVKNGIYTDAYVIDTAERTAYYKRTSYRTKSPIVEFETQEKEYVRAVYAYFVHEDSYHYRTGVIIKICYDKNNTNRFHIEDDGSHSEISTFLIGAGISMIIAVIILAIRY